MRTAPAVAGIHHGNGGGGGAAFGTVNATSGLVSYSSSGRSTEATSRRKRWSPSGTVGGTWTWTRKVTVSVAPSSRSASPLIDSHFASPSASGWRLARIRTGRPTLLVTANETWPCRDGG